MYTSLVACVAIWLCTPGDCHYAVLRQKHRGFVVGFEEGNGDVLGRKPVVATANGEMHRIRHHPELTPHEIPWPVKKEAVVEGDLVLGGLMMVHEREDTVTCGPVMPQGGVQALEAMLYTMDRLNGHPTLLPNISLGAHILDDCDKDTYGLEMAVDFIKGIPESSTRFVYAK